MNGGKDQVPGQGRLDGDLRGLLVPDLTDHHLIRVVPQDRPQASCKCQTLLLVDRNLGDPLELILDRVFDGDDLVLGRTDLRQTRVQRGRLARTCGAGHQHHSIGLIDEFAQLALGIVLKTEHIEIESLELGVGSFLVENPDNRVLTMNGRHDRHPEVDGAARKPDLEAAVLGNPFLGDIEFRHHLDAADNRRVVPFVNRFHRLIENPVDAVFDNHLAILGFDMDVGRAPLDRIEENRVNEADDGRRVGGDAVDGEDLLSVLRLLHQLHAEALGRLVENSLGRF